ncbi:MAG: hypothetical protein ACE5JM_03855 [Armatimonadota bacterium]
MRRARSQRAVAIGVMCVFALVGVGILLGAQRAIGQDQPKAPTTPDAEATPARPADRPGARGDERRREFRERGEELRRRFEQERARRFAGETMMRPAPAIAVAEGKVFVVMSGTLYKFDAETLTLEGQQRIPTPQPPFGMLRRAGREGEGGPRPEAAQRPRRDGGERPRAEGEGGDRN